MTDPLPPSDWQLVPAAPEEEPAPLPPLEPERPPEEVREAPFLLPDRAPPAVAPAPDAVLDLHGPTLFPPAVLEELPRPRRHLLQVGRFAILPAVAVAAAYDDNARATRTDREDEITANLTGTLRAQSLFPRHSLGFQVDATVAPLADTADSLFDWIARADGRLDLTRRSSLSAAASFTRGTENVESPEAGEEPTTITSVTGRTTYTQRGRLLDWRIGGGVGRLAAEDGAEADERSRTRYTAFTGADYRVFRRLRVFTDLSYAFNDFDAGTRDSHSVRGDAGVRLAVGRNLAATAGVGYSRLFFDDPERDDAQAVTALLGLDGVIRVDRFTAISVQADRSLQPVAVDDAAAATTTQATANVTRTLSPASAVRASVSYRHSDFSGIGRTDHDIIVRLGYSRVLTQNINLNVGYRFSRRFSDDDENEFYRNVISAGLSAAF